MPPFHTCPTQHDFDAYSAALGPVLRRELETLAATLNIDGLRQHISSLRDIAFTVSNIDPDGDPLMGGFNIHLPVVFADGVEWLVRISRQQVHRPPAALHRAVLESEISTLRFLHRAGFPVPEVYDVQFDEPTVLGVPFFIYEKMGGEPWNFDDATRTQFVSQYASFMIQLSQHSFPCLGSLSTDNGKVGPVLDPDFIESNDTTFARVGPFISSQQYYRHIIRGVLQDIRDSRRYISHTLDGYLVFLQLLDITDMLFSVKSKTAQFFIKHPDDKGDNFLVDDEGNLIAAIDWENTRTYSPEEAFAGPTFTINTTDFFAGVSTLSTEETILANTLRSLGRSDLATYVDNGKKYQFFQFCLGSYGVDRLDEFWPLFKALLKEGGLGDWNTWTEWKAHALKVYERDHFIKGLRARAQA